MASEVFDRLIRAAFERERDAAEAAARLLAAGLGGPSAVDLMRLARAVIAAGAPFYGHVESTLAAQQEQRALRRQLEGRPPLCAGSVFLKFHPDDPS